MANAGRIVADTIAMLHDHIRPGVSTGELDELAEEYIQSQGGTSSFKGYRGYPAAICTSPNDMVVHGIPNGRTVSEGDILSVDVGVILDGFVADSAFTFAVGEISPDAERLLEGCQAALAAGIAQCRAGNRLVGCLSCDPGRDRGGGVLGRPQPRRPRNRPRDARGPADPELRPAGPWAGAPARDDVRDRADDQRRRPRTCTCTTTSGRSRPWTARCRPTSSTPSRSPKTARKSSPLRQIRQKPFCYHEARCVQPGCASFRVLTTALARRGSYEVVCEGSSVSQADV